MNPAIAFLLTVFSLASTCPFLQAQEDRSFLHPPKIHLKANYSPAHQLQNRKFTGIPSLAVGEAGEHMWSVWYAGTSPGEDENNYVVLAQSLDAGETWEELLVIDPDGPGPVRAFDPEIWIDPIQCPILQLRPEVSCR